MALNIKLVILTFFFGSLVLTGALEFVQRNSAVVWQSEHLRLFNIAGQPLVNKTFYKALPLVKFDFNKEYLLIYYYSGPREIIFDHSAGCYQQVPYLSHRTADTLRYPNEIDCLPGLPEQMELSKRIHKNDIVSNDLHAIQATYDTFYISCAILLLHINDQCPVACTGLNYNQSIFIIDRINVSRLYFTLPDSMSKTQDKFYPRYFSLDPLWLFIGSVALFFLYLLFNSPN